MVGVHWQKSAFRTIILLSVLLLLLMPRTIAAPQNPGTELHLLPEAVQVTGGEILTLAIQVENVENLCRTELHMNYDAGLEILDSNPNRAGVQIAAGDVFGGCVQWNEVGEGVIHFVAHRDPDVGPFSGSGDLAQLTVKVTTSLPGGYLISFDRTAIRFLDCAGHPIDVLRATDGVLVITPTLNGVVARDGWSTYSGSQVSAYFFRAGGSAPVAQGSTFTNEKGDFLLNSWTLPPTDTPPSTSPPPGCSAGWTYARLSYPYYLAECYRVCALSDSVDIGERQLEGGDINGDGCINISDIVLIIGNYGQEVDEPCTPSSESLHPAPQGDINGDCRVNILDLTQAAGNFGLCSNCP